ncbi:MAG: helix-turn-helix domain-containing protein [Natronosporangium sp.]
MIAPVTPEQLAEARRNLGSRLASLREAAGLTQAQLARLTGYSRSTVANVETGRGTQPRTSWARYDQILHVGGVLLADYNNYATLTARQRQHAAEERERQRTARLEQWRRAAEQHEPARLDAPASSYIDRGLHATVRGGEPAGAVVTATIVQEATNDWKVDATNRRQALATALGLTAAEVIDAPQPASPGADMVALLGSLPPDPNQLEPGHGDSVAAYGELSQHLWRLYWSAPAGPLFDAAYAQVRLGVDLLGGASGRNRHRLGDALALSALLAARLAVFDLSRPGAATRCHQVALAAASEGEDRTMAAIVLGHMAFVPAFTGQPTQAEALTDTALRSAHGTGSLVTSWLHCVASEAHARAGNGPASLRQIELAEAAYVDGEPVPGWFDFYDSVRLDCFAGYTAMAAGDHTLAASRLRRAADSLGETGAKQRSVIQSDLAATCKDDPDRAAHHLHQAIDALEGTWYSTGWDRVRQTRNLLSDSQLGQDVDQRLALLPGGRP